MFPIEAGKIEKRDRIIPSLSGKHLYYLTLIGAFLSKEQLKSVTLV